MSAFRPIQAYFATNCLRPRCSAFNGLASFGKRQVLVWRTRHEYDGHSNYWEISVRLSR